MVLYDKLFKNLKLTANQSRDILKTYEMLKKCFIFFVVSIFKIVVLCEVCTFFSNTGGLNGLLYLILSVVIFDNTITISTLFITSMFVFTLAVVILCVFFNKKVNNETKAVNAFNGGFFAVNEKYNS